MDGKFFLGLGAVVSAGAYFGGGLGGGDYARIVGAPPAEVRAALMDLDIREAPGEPGTDPSRSGGIAPAFELTEQGNDMVWTVKSGADVAVRLIAHLEPIEGGAKTRVTTASSAVMPPTISLLRRSGPRRSPRACSRWCWKTSSTT